MSVIPARRGQPFFVTRLLPGLTSAFVKATITQETVEGSTAFPGSPFLVPHVDNGRYVLRSLSFPADTDVKELHVLLEVYSDEELTIPSDIHESTLDVYIPQDAPVSCLQSFSSEMVVVLEEQEPEEIEAVLVDEDEEGITVILEDE